MIGKGVNELRISNRGMAWRVIYRIDIDAIVIIEVFKKKTRKTPQRIFDTCKRRLKEYEI